VAPTLREIVLRTLNFDNPPRVPRQLWTVPWAGLHHPRELEEIVRDFPPDITGADGHLRERAPETGDPYAVGEYTDPWGCRFQNLQAGVIGEVKEPQVRDWEADGEAIRIPVEWLTVDADAVNRDCDSTDLFVLAGTCPRPFEQLQFLRGTEAAYLDLADPPDAMVRFLWRMRDFYRRLMETWARTRVDGLMFMDDWGSQQNLLISPDTWREVFRPFYKDFIDIAHAAGKKAFMHSDGNILAVYPELVGLGLDAVNSQLFCMGVENLKPYAGKITFWGEIDRRHLLPHGTPGEISAAVREVRGALWRGGGCIAQCEFGPGARPENVRRVFEEWSRVQV
jgi:uroporphyrinogen decarboxylase